ncbi:MAG: hypothetical protein KDI48_06860 [Xanthomonadales bacterium]|nr:hypothetical protein [Xanthomonadales bacterium]
MLIPEFWAEARVRHRGTDARGRNRQWTVRRFGWSQLSQADAEAMAQKRADSALQRIVAGESLPRREAKVPYNSADGLPIREEVLERLEHGAVVTRNSYGAHCLNTPDVLFADLDFEPDLRAGAIIALIMVTVIVLGLTIWRFGALHAVGVTLVSFMLFGVLAWRRQRTQSAHRERWFAEAQRRVEASAQADPQALLALYRTPMGLRVLALHRQFDPDSTEVAELFKAWQVDHQYSAMCRRQQCFRARLTGKPWRMGIGDPMRPRPGVWPVAPERQAERDHWVSAYESQARAFAACHFIGLFGAGQADPIASRIREIHDQRCRSESALPLA